MRSPGVKKKLPDLTREQLRAKFDSIDTYDGKKATAWVTHVDELSSQDF